MDDLIPILSLMRSKGLRLWTEHGQVRYEALRGVLTPQEIATCQRLTPEAMACLQPISPDSSRSTPLAPRLPTDRIPLTFSQQWVWNVLDLERRPSTRSIAVALRLSGPLQVQWLSRSLTQLTRRHESLRTRVVLTEAVPWQVIGDPLESALDTIDLSGLTPERREKQAQTLAQHLVHEPYRVSVGPLFAARLLRLSAQEHVLVIAADHLISDYASLGILLRDLWTLYAQRPGQTSPALPVIAVQFADYAVWQYCTRRSWMEQHGAYWSRRLSGFRPLRLFEKGVVPALSSVRMTRLPIQIGERQTTLLRQFARRARTTMTLVVLAAYVASLSRVCNESDLLVAFIAMERSHPEIRHTVGYFATALLLRIVLQEEDDFLALLSRVTEEYGASCAHADSGRMLTQNPQPQFASNPRFNWIPAGLDVRSVYGRTDVGAVDPNDPTEIRQAAFDIPPRDDLDGRNGGPELLLSDAGDTISGALWYRADLIASHTATHLERNFTLFLDRMVTAPDARVRTAPVAAIPG